MDWNKLLHPFRRRQSAWLLAILSMPVLLQQCKCVKYGLSGINIPPDVSTISVKYFPNQAPLVSPTLSQNFTEKIKDKFLRETNLSVVTADGDFQISGVINTYKIEPVAVTANTGTAKNRLTIGAQVDFKCPKHKDLEFSENISNFAEFDAAVNFQTVESALTEEITQKMVQDIFNKVALKW